MSLKPIVASRYDRTKFVNVPVEIFNKFFFREEWREIEIPDINDVSKYLGISSNKIMEDIIKEGCPLLIFSKGSRGRGKATKFVKESVEQYKAWLNNKEYFN